MVSQALKAGGRDRSLDGWRGLALLGVLFDHFVTPRVLNLGRFGVEMFFVLSGMLMADILFVKRAPIGEFFVRRFSRIYPAMFVFATLTFIFSLATGLIAISAQAYASVLTFTENYVSILWHRTYDYDHIWSLCIEQHSYLCLGAVAALSRWRGTRPIPIIVCLIALAVIDGALSTWIFHRSYNAVYWRTDVRGGSILIGSVTYILLHERPDWARWIKAPEVFPICSTVALVTNIGGVPDPIKYSFGTVMVAISAASLSQAHVRYRRFFEHPALVTIGAASYSLYLWQEPFSEFDSAYMKWKLLPFGLLCGVVSYVFVEGPARRVLNRLARARPTLPPEASIPN